MHGLERGWVESEGWAWCQRKRGDRGGGGEVEKVQRKCRLSGGKRKGGENDIGKEKQCE